MPYIIRDAEFKTCHGEGLWPGMWVHTCGWGHKHAEPSPLHACYLWRVEQHDGVMLLAGQGVDVLVPLTAELADDCFLIKESACELLADFPAEWAALRKLGWGVYLDYYTTGGYHFYHRLRVHCRRGYREEYFFLAEHQQHQLDEHPEILHTLLVTTWWRIKHPRYADALAAQQQTREFWDWPNVPAPKELHRLGQAAWRTVQGSVGISPDGKLTATGRKRWEFPGEDDEDSST